MTTRQINLNPFAKKATILWFPKIPFNSYKTVELMNMVNEGNLANPVMVKRKATAYYCDNNDIEYILRTINEFEDIQSNERLRLNTGAK